jgi:hypothetical protein
LNRAARRLAGGTTLGSIRANFRRLSGDLKAGWRPRPGERVELVDAARSVIEEGRLPASTVAEAARLLRELAEADRLDLKRLENPHPGGDDLGQTSGAPRTGDGPDPGG